jgi:TPR repeat protein
MKISPFLLAFAVQHLVHPCLADGLVGVADVFDSGAVSALHERVDQYRQLRGDARDLSDAALIAQLRQYAEEGDAAAKVLLADSLVLLNGDATALDEALSLFADEIGQGTPGASLGYAKALLMGGLTEKNRQTIMEELMEASMRGSAEADRLLSLLVLDSYDGDASLADSWALLLRSAQREDASACVELADAYLNGTWRECSLSVNGEVADRLLLVASRKGSPEAALRRAIRLTRNGVDTTDEDYEESVRELYNTYLWAHKQGNVALIEAMDALHEQGAIYLRTWLRAHFLYENTINPSHSVQMVGSDGALGCKERAGIRQILKIEGGSDGSTLSVLGFPCDAPYLWDGEVEVLENGSLSVPENDLYWSSVLRRLKSGGAPCFVRILDGEYAGFVVYVHPDWVAGEDRQIALENITNASLFGQKARIALGQWRSLFSVFGEFNSLGLRPGTSASDADQVILYNSGVQRVDRYYFDSDLMAWVRADEPGEAAADVALPPWQAVFVLRREKAAVELTVDGVRSETPATLPIDPGFNLVANLEGKLLDGLAASDIQGKAIRADEFPVYMVSETGGLYKPEESVHWWCLLGIPAETPIYVNTPSAYILTGSEQTQSFYLQR